MTIGGVLQKNPKSVWRDIWTAPYFDLLANKLTCKVVLIIYLLRNQLANSLLFFLHANKHDLKSLSKLAKTHYATLDTNHENTSPDMLAIDPTLVANTDNKFPCIMAIETILDTTTDQTSPWILPIRPILETTYDDTSSCILPIGPAHSTHCILQASSFPFHTPHCPLHTSHKTLFIEHSALQTFHFHVLLLTENSTQ